MRIRTSRSVRLALLVVAVSILTGPSASARDGSSLATRIRGVLADKALRGAVVAIHVETLDEGAVLYTREADRPLTPGSNVKLLTTAAALHALGTDYRFRTTVSTDGSIRGDLLEGDLVLTGGGDPCLSGLFHDGDPTAALERLAAEIRERGIARVRGDLVIDAGFFDEQIHHPSWPADQLHLRYCAPIAAFSINDNCVDFEIRPARVLGARAVVEANPVPAGFTIENRVETVGATRPPRARIDLQWRETPGYHFVVRGTISSNCRPYRAQAPIQQPVWYAAELFREALDLAGIRVEGATRVRTSTVESRAHLLSRVAHTGTGAGRPQPGFGDVGLGATTILAEHRSPLVDGVQVTNERSQNFYAEQILKTLGRERRANGSFESGCEVVVDFLREIGCETDGTRLVDGSGLSRSNRVTARSFVKVLRHMLLDTDPDVSRAFFVSLPVSGQRGSLLSRMKEDAYRGRVAAKTGYVYRASALSGYARTDSGETRVFSILMNDFKAPNSKMKQLQDRIVRYLVDGAR